MCDCLGILEGKTNLKTQRLIILLFLAWAWKILFCLFISWCLTLWWSLCLSCWIIPFFFFLILFLFFKVLQEVIYLLHESCRLFIIRQVLSRWYKYRDLCRYIDVCTAVVLILDIDADLDMYIFEIS